MDKEHTHTHTHWTITSHKKGNFAFGNNMDGPKGIILSEISQRKTNTVYFHLYVDSKKNKMNKYNKTETNSLICKTN